MKLRVAFVHPEWSLSGVSEVESDYWEVETPASEKDSIREVWETSAAVAEGAEETGATDAMSEETVVMVKDDPPT